MNSIEKFVDRLTQSSPNSTAPSSPNAAPGGAVPSIDRQEPQLGAAQRTDVAEIDLAQLKAAGMVTPDNARSLIAEEYRAIKRPLLKNAFGEAAVGGLHPNLIMVTSSLPGEGKSFSSINLAMSIAMELDHTVLLVEADVAKPAMARYLGLPVGEKGLVDYLADDRLSLDELLVRTNVPKLSLLRAGRSHTQATELLASQNMRRLTQELAQRYPDRVVIFDSPPILVSSEAAVLATLVGQIVVVVESEKTPQRVVKDALNMLGRDKIIGIILNKSRGSSSQGFGYGSYGSQGYGRS